MANKQYAINVLRILRSAFCSGKDIKRLNLKLKKQLIIAVYEVAMHKAEGSLEEAIRLYQEKFSLDFGPPEP